MTGVPNLSSADPPVTRLRLRKQPDQPKTPEISTADFIIVMLVVHAWYGWNQVLIVCVNSQLLVSMAVC